MPTMQNILIALPTTGGGMKSGTAMTIAKTVRALMAQGIHVDLHNVDSAEIVTARDICANILLHSPQHDAMLFIDSDMAFDPRLVLRLVALGREVAAAACPRRILHLDRFVAAAQSHGNYDKALAEASDFTVLFDWEDRHGRPLKVENGFTEAAAVGMACALISRSALQAMVEAKAVAPRADLDAGPDRTCWSFFDIVTTESERLGEDYSFCYRWTKLMGRKLSVCLDEEVRHIGNYDFTARYADLL